MSTIIQLLVSGIAMGFIYCLVAVEYTLIWNATGLINFAHERFIVLGAFCFGGFAVNYFADNYLVAIALTMVFMAVFGLVVAFIVINPLRNMPSTIFAVMGMLMTGYIMREGIRIIWGPSPFTVPGFISGTVHLFDAVLPKVYIIIIIISVLLLIVQKIFMTKTKTGKAVRCVAQDKEAAALMGIDVRRNIAITVAISSMICGLIGILVIPGLFGKPYNGEHDCTQRVCSRSHRRIRNVFGSAGRRAADRNCRESVPAGGPSIYKDVVAFVLLIVVLMIRPKGIMAGGKAEIPDDTEKEGHI